MSLREKLAEKLFNRISGRIEDNIRSGVSAFHTQDGWQTGSFSSQVYTTQIEVHIEEQEIGASVYAVTEDGKKSREWSILDDELSTGVESAAGAVFDVTHNK